MNPHLKAYVSHNSIWIMALVLIACLLFIGSGFTTWSTWLCLAIGALLFFSTEYTTHRFFFHMAPPKNEFMLNLVKRLHYDHHEFPTDLHLLFLPVWYSLPQNVLLWGITYAITRSTVLATAIFSGAIIGLLYYEWVHFVAHRTLKPRTTWGKWMKKYHLWHHYKSENYWFGVSNPVWDYLMGTFKNEKEVELSPTARKLHQDHQVQQSL